MLEVPTAHALGTPPTGVSRRCLSAWADPAASRPVGGTHVVLTRGRTAPAPQPVGGSCEANLSARADPAASQPVGGTHVAQTRGRVAPVPQPAGGSCAAHCQRAEPADTCSCGRNPRLNLLTVTTKHHADGMPRRRLSQLDACPPCLPCTDRASLTDFGPVLRRARHDSEGAVSVEKGARVRRPGFPTPSLRGAVAPAAEVLPPTSASSSATALLQAGPPALS